MTKLSFQFHAMHDEIISLVADLLADDSIFATKIAGVPCVFTQVAKGESIHIDSLTHALAFTPSAPNLSVKSIDAFRATNPDALILSIGKVKDAGLAESWLSAMSDNETVMKRWQKTINRLRSEMLTGAVAVNPKNGTSVLMKGHRFTVGVQKAYLKGLLLLPAAGNSVVHIPM